MLQDFLESSLGMYVCNFLADIVIGLLIWKRTGKLKLESSQIVSSDIAEEDLQELIAYHEQTAEKLKKYKKGG